MDRLQEKHSLLVKLGALFGPLLRLIEHPEQYDDQERSESLARYFAECPSLQREFEKFAKGQPGHNYMVEFLKFYTALDGVQNGVFQNQPLATLIPKQLQIAQAAIDAVPVPRTSVVIEAGSPFTAYCKIKQLCEADASQSLVLLDPYLSSVVFHRFLEGVRSTVPITLVTTGVGAAASARDRDRWNDFLDVSRLFAAQRGPTLYRLVEQPNLHDRWIVFDEKRLYALGGSSKDAGNRDYFTITGVEPSRENLARVKSHVDTGTEFFGPGTTNHR